MESLPVELLRRIASDMPYPTIYSLALTSHKLRAAVHDWQVYKSVIDNQVHLLTADPKSPDGVETVTHSILKQEITLPPWTRNPITVKTPPETAARYAYADYKAYNLPTKVSLWGSNIHPEALESYPQDELDTGPLRDFAKWGGVLAAYGHPLLHLIGHTNIHSDSGGKNIWIPGPAIPTSRYTLGFCIAAHLLSDNTNLLPHIEPEEEPEEEDEGTIFGPGTGYSTPQEQETYLDTTETYLDAKWRAVLTNISALYEDSYISPRPYRDMQYEGRQVPRTRVAINDSYGSPGKGTLKQSYSAFTLLDLSVKTVGVMGWHYKKLILDGRIPRFRILRWEFGDNPTEEQAAEVKRRYDPRQLWGPPVASKIPFEKYMKLEPELGKNGAGFVWSHLEGMMNKEFLEEGKWMGYYSYRDMREIDPAMIDIAFEVVDPKEIEPQRGPYDTSDDDSEDEDEDEEDEDEEDEDGEDDEDDEDEDDGEEYEDDGEEYEDDGEEYEDDGEEYEDDGEEYEDEDRQHEVSEKSKADEPAGIEEIGSNKGKGRRGKSPDVPIIAVKAIAKDGIGDFAIWGKFYPQTGKVHLTKIYFKDGESGTMWNWTAFMTPFGIVGRWGTSGFGGYVWLWKEDWHGHPADGN
ncbi:hypothetical protein TWF481_002231 [Arthrobotrys musiformis]|uniref:F-box domain-containing protein n=1 Tax=Arthrobotrys musiformis TaxID=47236 RepID=A0AAV9VVF4_9PEZI